MIDRITTHVAKGINVCERGVELNLNKQMELYVKNHPQKESKTNRWSGTGKHAKSRIVWLEYLSTKMVLSKL